MEAGTFMASVDPPGRRAEAHVLDTMFRTVTGQLPAMWGPTIIGYGRYDTVYDSGRAVTSLRVGFSPRKAKHALYLMASGEGGEAPFAPMLAQLGRHSLGQACLYLTRLDGVDLTVLAELIDLAWQRSLARYPA